MDRLTEKFSLSLCTFNLGGGVLIALSGGADSVCLLDLFVKAKKNGSFPYEIAAAHLNHNLRGDEAIRDADFCRSLCEGYGVKFFLGNADVPSMARESGKGVEEAARRARYDFLQKAACENGFSYIATAHNRGDLCETAILNLVRGASLHGMCSIPKKRGNIIRPILNVSKAEIIEYNERASLPFVTDSTNLSLEYSRNRIRHSVLPELEKLYGGAEESIERCVSLLKRDADYLNEAASRLYGEVVCDGVLYTEKAQNLHPSMLTRITKMLYNYYGFEDLTEAHINAVCHEITAGKKDFTLSLHGCFALCERGRLRFTAELPSSESFCVPIEIGQTVTLPCGTAVTLSSEKLNGSYPLKASSLSGKLELRSRREGDTAVIFSKTHKLKRMISDKKLSLAQKARLFLLTSNGEIIYSNLPLTADKAFAGSCDECVYITVKETDL